MNQNVSSCEDCGIVITRIKVVRHHAKAGIMDINDQYGFHCKACGQEDTDMGTEKASDFLSKGYYIITQGM